MITLDLLPEGGSGKIILLEGGGRFLSRITAMGFTPDTDVMVVRNGKWGPLIVQLRDTEIALGRGEASKIQIKGVGE